MDFIVAPVHALAEWWYGMAGFLPLPLHAVSFVVVSYLALYFTFKHFMPAFGKGAPGLVRGPLRATLWLLAVPEYAVTDLYLRRTGRLPVGAYSYGEALARSLQAVEAGTAAFCLWLQKRRKAERLATLTVLAATFLVNAAAYRSNQELPFSSWWSSIWDPIQSWAEPSEDSADG